MIIANIAFVTENTGGGNTAAVAYVEGGAIVLTDGNFGTDFGAFTDFGIPAVDAGWYPGNTWNDGEGTVFAEGDSPDAAVEALLAAIRQAA